MRTKQEWLAEAMLLRRQLAERPSDADLIAKADALAREGHRLGMFRLIPKGVDAGLGRDPMKVVARREAHIKRSK